MKKKKKQGYGYARLADGSEVTLGEKPATPPKYKPGRMTATGYDGTVIDAADPASADKAAAYRKKIARQQQLAEDTATPETPGQKNQRLSGLRSGFAAGPQETYPAPGSPGRSQMIDEELDGLLEGRSGAEAHRAAMDAWRRKYAGDYLAMRDAGPAKVLRDGQWVDAGAAAREASEYQMDLRGEGGYVGRPAADAGGAFNRRRTPQFRRQDAGLPPMTAAQAERHRTLGEQYGRMRTELRNLEAEAPLREKDVELMRQAGTPELLDKAESALADVKKRLAEQRAGVERFAANLNETDRAIWERAQGGGSGSGSPAERLAEAMESLRDYRHRVRTPDTDRKIRTLLAGTPAERRRGVEMARAAVLGLNADALPLSDEARRKIRTLQDSVRPGKDGPVLEVEREIERVLAAELPRGQRRQDAATVARALPAMLAAATPEEIIAAIESVDDPAALEEAAAGDRETREMLAAAKVMGAAKAVQLATRNRREKERHQARTALENRLARLENRHDRLYARYEKAMPLTDKQRERGWTDTKAELEGMLAGVREEIDQVTADLDALDAPPETAAGQDAAGGEGSTAEPQATRKVTGVFATEESSRDLGRDIQRMLASDMPPKEIERQVRSTPMADLVDAYGAEGALQTLPMGSEKPKAVAGVAILLAANLKEARTADEKAAVVEAVLRMVPGDQFYGDIRLQPGAMGLAGTAERTPDADARRLVEWALASGYVRTRKGQG